MSDSGGIRAPFPLRDFSWWEQITGVAASETQAWLLNERLLDEQRLSDLIAAAPEPAPAPAPPYRCTQAQCNSADVIAGGPVLNLVPGPDGPREVRVGGNYVCNRCGHPMAVTREGQYLPLTRPPGMMPEGARDVVPAGAADGDAKTVSPRWRTR